MASENGWEPARASADQCEWVTVPGTSVNLQLLKGHPLTILRAFAADFNAYVEPLRDADSAGWTPTNAVPTSNHLNATAIDLNWNSHPFHVRGTYGDRLPALRELLDWYEGTVWFGGDWQDPIDEMHFNMGYNTYGNPHTGDFINRKIRADGYSTLRRGNTVEPPPKSDQSRVLADAAGLPLDRARDILPAVQQGLRLSQCTNAKRIAMWLAQIGHESDSFQATEEYAKNGRYAPYIGRTWIQITWDYNYRAFGRWCAKQGLVTDPNVFVNDPAALAELKWAGIGPAWYWTVQRADINELSDRHDLETVTYRINGGDNGLADRRARYNRALAVGDGLLTLIAPQPQLSDSLEELLMLKVPSLSIYANPGEPDVDVVDMIRALDAHGDHEAYVERQARLGDSDALSRVVRTAAGKGKYGNTSGAVNQAKAVLAEIETVSPALLQRFVNGAN